MQDDDITMEDADTAVVDSNDVLMADVIMEDVELLIEEAAEGGGANEFERFGEEEASQNGGVCRLPLLPSFDFQGLTPEDCHFRMAESQFHRMSRNTTKMVRFKIHIYRRLSLSLHELRMTSNSLHASALLIRESQ